MSEAPLQSPAPALVNATRNTLEINFGTEELTKLILNSQKSADEHLKFLAEEKAKKEEEARKAAEAEKADTGMGGMKKGFLNAEKKTEKPPAPAAAPANPPGLSSAYTTGKLPRKGAGGAPPGIAPPSGAGPSGPRESTFRYLYAVQLNDPVAAENKRMYIGTGTAATLDGLVAGMDYRVRVQILRRTVALSEEEVIEEVTSLSPWASMATKAPTPPPPPAAITLASRTRVQLGLKWKKPDDDGGHPITQYRLETDKGSGGALFFTEFEGTELSHKVTKLMAGKVYTFRVAAKNKLGFGPWSETVEFATQASVPAAPSNISVKGLSPTSLRLTWEAPECHGAEIEGYNVERALSSDGVFVACYHGDEPSCEVNGLVHATPYKFRVMAENSVGHSVWSPVLEVTTASTPPEPVRPPVMDGKPTQSSIPVRWNPPEDNGSAISGYVLKVLGEFDGDASHLPSVELRVNEPSATLTSLLPGRKYKVSVRAENAAGIGGFGTTTTLSTMPGRPAAPAVPSAVRDKKRKIIRVHWTEPHCNGDAITSYECEALATGHNPSTVYSGSETSCEVSDLLPGVEYTFRVLAVNTVGRGSWSPSCSITTGASVPSQVEGVTVVSSSAKAASIKWSPAQENGSSVTLYRVQMDGEEVWSGADCHAQVTGLPPATTLCCRVSAINSVGAGPWSDEVTISTPAGRPSAPAAPRVETVSQSALRVIWKEPRSNGAPVTAYRVNMDGKCVYNGPETHCTVDGLAAGGVYKLTVQALNAAGESPLSAVAAASTAAGLPGRPSSLRLMGEVAHNSAKVQWKACGDGNKSSSVSYLVEVAEARIDKWLQVYRGSSTNCKIAKINPKATYKVRVAALNEAGQGDWCSELQFTTLPAPPPAPEKPTVAAQTVDSVKIRWSLPKQQNLKACLEMGTGDQGTFEEVYSGRDMVEYHVDGLSVGSTVRFRMRCVGDDGIRGTYCSTLVVKLAAPEEASVARPDNAGKRPAMDVGVNAARIKQALLNAPDTIANIHPNIIALIMALSAYLLYKIFA